MTALLLWLSIDRDSREREWEGETGKPNHNVQLGNTHRIWRTKGGRGGGKAHSMVPGVFAAGRQHSSLCGPGARQARSRGEALASRGRAIHRAVAQRAMQVEADFVGAGTVLAVGADPVLQPKNKGKRQAGTSACGWLKESQFGVYLQIHHGPSGTDGCEERKGAAGAARGPAPPPPKKSNGAIECERRSGAREQTVQAYQSGLACEHLGHMMVPAAVSFGGCLRTESQREIQH